MPTPEANASSTPTTTATVALRNANITELAIDEAEADSFKANNVSIIMTQDQCLDNGHQQAAAANSNKRSSSDNKVSDDDLNSSKNSVVSNGVNISVQEFNVDVNSEREHNTDLVIVQNRTVVDADSPPTGEVLPTTTASKQLLLLTEIPSSESKDILKDNLLNNTNNNIDANKSDCANNIIDANMTVITHQNSNENMRDIIANSEKANSNKDATQLDKVAEKNAKSDLNSRNNNANKSVAPRRHRKLIRSDNVNECEDVDQAEDPIERLNKLRASISSALSEVKGVLKQYSTEQSCDDQGESGPSKQQSTTTATDDGPVRFRFVRKIRRRSVFSEDDETEIPKTTTDVLPSPIIENKVSEEVPNEFQDIQKNLSNENTVAPQLEEIAKPIINDTEESGKNLIEKVSTEIQVAQDKNDNGSTTVSDEIQKTTKEDSLTNICEAPASILSTPKTKNGKTKKIVKKDRRASIAAVEINKISNADHESPEIPPLELKTQRRPSDSGTLVKQPTRIRTKTSEKPKLTSTRKTKTASSSKTESSTTKPKNETEVKAVDIEKADATLSPPTEIEKSSSQLTVDSTNTSQISASAVIENQIKPPVSEASLSVIGLQSTQETTSPAIEKLVASEPPATVKLSPTITEANTPRVTSVDQSNITEVKPAPTVKADISKISPKAAGTSVVNLNAPSEPSSVSVVSSATPKSTEINKPAGSSVGTLNAPSKLASAPVVTSTSPKVIEVNKSAGTSIVKQNKPEATPAPAVNSKAKDGLSQSIPETAVSPVKPNISKTPSLKINTDAAVIKVEIPDQQTSTPISNKLNAPVPSTKIPDASPATSKSTTEAKTATQLPIQSNKQTNMSPEAEQIKVSKPATASVNTPKTMQTVAEKIVANKTSAAADSNKVSSQLKTSETAKRTEESLNQIDKNKTSETQDLQADSVEVDVPKPTNVPKDAVAVKLKLPGQESVEELQRLEEKQQDDNETSPPQTPETPETPETTAASAPPKKKRKAKRKVVIRRIKRKLSKDDTFLLPQEAAVELEICEKEIEEKGLDEEEPAEEVPEPPKQPKSCLKIRQYEIGDVVMYAEHYKKTQVRWKKAVVTERITSISYKLDIEGGDERPAHISYIKKFTDRKVNFGGKEYLEIDYAQIEENEEKEHDDEEDEDDENDWSVDEGNIDYEEHDEF